MSVATGVQLKIAASLPAGVREARVNTLGESLLKLKLKLSPSGSLPNTLKLSGWFTLTV